MNAKIKTIKQALFVMALMVGALSLVSFFPTALAAGGAISDADNPQIVANLTGGEGSIRALVLRIVNFFLGFLGIVAVLMVIYGGVTYVTAAGNDDAVGNAKKIILYALVGIVIIMLSFALVNTILGAGTGVQA